MRPTAAVLAADPRRAEVLDGDQAARHARLRRPEDRDGFLAARLLTLDLLTRLHLDDVALGQRCPTCGGPHGRPHVVGRDDLHVSWAHAGGLVAAAVAHGPVGVDVEPLRPGARPPLGVGSWEAWVRGEALVKRGDADLDTVLRWDLTGPDLPRGLTDLGGPHVGWVGCVAGPPAPAT